MPKSSKKQIDDDEKKVIRELQRNSKESIDKLAKKCGFSRQKVWRIIKRLENNRTIWGYHAIVDEKKQNMKSYVILFKGKHLPIENTIEENIVNKTIDKLGEKIGVIVEDSYWLHGLYDIMICFFAKDLKTAKKFQEIFINTYTENISELHLIEKIVTIKKGGFMNPKIKETKSLLQS